MMNDLYQQLQTSSRHIIVCLSVAMMFLCTGALSAQNVAVTGRVMDENKAPLSGVTVLIKGANAGTICGTQGEFTINVPKGSTLAFSFIGYKTYEVPITTQRTVNVQLVPDALNLDDVVVVGYGTQKRSHFAGASSSLNPDSYKLDEIPADGLDKLLQGRMAGMMVQDKSGQVGQDAEIRIRGNASFSADSNPLVVVDGLPTTGNLSDINVNDVASIEVLKDAASTAIYGSRGANGIIMVTTKQGSKSKTQFSVKYQTGITNVMKYYDTYSLEEYAEQFYKANVLYPWETDYLSRGMEVPNGINADGSYNKGPGGKLSYLPYDKFLTTELNPVTKGVYNKNGAGYAQLLRLNRMVGAVDPQRSVTQTGYSHKATLSAQGGSDKIKYYLSTSFADESGVMIKNKSQSISVAANISAQVHPKITVDMKLNPRYKKSRLSSSAQLGGALRWLTHPLTYDEKSLMMMTAGKNGVPGDVSVGDYIKSRDFRNIWLLNDEMTDYVRDAKGAMIPINTYSGTGDVTSYALAMDSRDLRKEYGLTGNLGVNWNVLKGLVFRTTLGTTVRANLSEVWAGSYTKSKGALTSGKGAASYSQAMFSNIVNENTLTYDFKICSDHRFNVLAGFSLESTVQENLKASGDEFPSDLIQTLNYAGIIVATETNNNRQEEALVSGFFRLNYNYKDKYMFSGVFRMDGSSQFGPDKRWGSFPSVSVAWRLKQEEFLKNVTWLSDLKLRASYGISGNNRITRYSYITSVGKTVYPTGSGSDVINGYGPSSTLGNREISWEQTNAANLGVNVGLFSNRVSLSVDVYLNKTKALLLKTPTPFMSGYSTQWSNVGKMQNKGIEIELNTVNIAKSNFSWTMNTTLSSTSSRLIDYGTQDEELFTGYKESVYRLQVGRTPGEYYGYKTNGKIWKSTAEINEGIANGQAVGSTLIGDPKFVDLNKDGKITSDDMTSLGSSTPKFEWGWANNFRIYRFDVSFMFQGSHGAKVWNMTNLYGGNYLRNMQDDIYVDAFHGNRPKFGNNAVSNCDYLIEDASYIALRNLSVGYSIPKCNIRVYASARNLLYFMSKGYNGINPEFRSEYDGRFTPEQRMTTVPLMRTFSAGVDIKF